MPRIIFAEHQNSRDHWNDSEEADAKLLNIKAISDYLTT